MIQSKQEITICRDGELTEMEVTRRKSDLAEATKTTSVEVWSAAVYCDTRYWPWLSLGLRESTPGDAM